MKARYYFVERDALSYYGAMHGDTLEAALDLAAQEGYEDDPDDLVSDHIVILRAVEVRLTKNGRGFRAVP